MFKSLALVLALSVCTAFAVESELGRIEAPGRTVSLDIPPPDVLYDTGYDYGLMIQGVPTAPGPGWVSADDMVFDEYVYIDMITAYILVNQTVPDSFDIRFWEDSGSGPGTEIDSAPCECTLTSTGQFMFGYLIYRAEMVLDTVYELEAGHYWFAGGYTSGYWYWTVQYNYFDDMVYFDYGGGGSGPWYSSQYMWGQAYDFFFTVEGEAGPPDTDPPYVDGMDPDEGEYGVPPDSDIIFHCKDDLSGVDIDTIDFTVQDTTLSGRFASIGCDPIRTVPGDLDIDDTDPLDVVCTFDPTNPFYEGEDITCTVDGELADNAENEMGDDFVWTFYIYGDDVTETTWGAIKAEF
ncbi:Ig-like domain-containing protein, partial [bacterium]|nr:Ig-like domain-containing protein [bacterium]